MPPIIEARNLGKLFNLGVSGPSDDNFREVLLRVLKMPFQAMSRTRVKTPVSRGDNSIWALKDINFDVDQGEVVGIIGKNGAGKSTLLKILSRITEPSTGHITIRGRLSSLLEVGTGFHPELTGRENIFMNGAILGMRKAEITAKFDEIVAFAEIEKFLDTPVKRYSSGMYVRLAFAVSAHLDPEILVVDEVLAVGDLAFQKKCLGKMGEVSQGGRTVLFVSHNMAAVEGLCRSGMVLDQGAMSFRGPIKEAIDHYLRNVSTGSQANGKHWVDLTHAPTRSPKFPPLLKRLEFYNGNGEPLNGGLPTGAPLRIAVVFTLQGPNPSFDIILGIDNVFGQRIFTASTWYEPDRQFNLKAGEQTLVCEIPSLPLLPGDYKIKAVLDIGSGTADRVDDAAYFTINPSDFFGTGKMPEKGLLAIPQRWRAG